MLEHGSLAYSAEGRSWSWYRAWCGTLAAWGLGLALAFAHWLRTLAVARAWWECEVLSMCVRAGPGAGRGRRESGIMYIRLAIIHILG